MKRPARDQHADPSDDRRRRGGVPRWATVIGLLAALALALYLVTMLIGGGHGPSQHAPENPPAEQSELDADHGPPRGGHG